MICTPSWENGFSPAFGESARLLTKDLAEHDRLEDRSFMTGCSWRRIWEWKGMFFFRCLISYELNTPQQLPPLCWLRSFLLRRSVAVPLVGSPQITFIVTING